jgi:hypothetical protein
VIVKEYGLGESRPNWPCDTFVFQLCLPVIVKCIVLLHKKEKGFDFLKWPLLVRNSIQYRKYN